MKYPQFGWEGVMKRVRCGREWANEPKRVIKQLVEFVYQWRQFSSLLGIDPTITEDTVSCISISHRMGFTKGPRLGNLNRIKPVNLTK